MGERDLAVMLHRIRQTAAEVGGVSDGELLQRFLTTRDEAAFELLLWRHARLVLGLCQRVLHDLHDAEDAFQATVLILARRAGRIRKQDAVASWLYKVAYRVALTLRAKRCRQGAHERPLSAASDVAAPAAVSTPLEQHELQETLDREVNRLPERLRAAIVLCYLEGKTVDQAALQIGCPRGTVASRLARARERLRLRLARRGLALAAGLTALQQADAASRPLQLISSLLPLAVRSSGSAVTEASLSRNVIALSHEVLKAMFWHKLKTSIVMVFAVAGLLATGGGLAVHLMRANAGAAQAPAAEPPTEQANKPAPEKEKPPERKPLTASHPVRRDFVPSEDYMGRLEALRTVEVRASVSGRLETIEFKPGAEVTKGAVLFEMASAAYRLARDKAQANLEVAWAHKRLAEADLTRARALEKAKSIGQEDYDKIAAAAVTADANLKVANAALEQARLNLDGTRVRAPVDGVISRPLVDLGNYTNEEGGRSLLLATISTLDPLRLSFDMDERNFLRYRRLLRDGEVKGPGSALAMELLDEKGFSRTGTLEGFDVRIDPKTGTVRVHGVFPNRDRLLLPGLSARVRIPFGRSRPVLEVPQEAVQGSQAANAYVYVVGEHDKIQMRPVKLGPSDNGMRVIEEGVDENDWVVENVGKLGQAGRPITVERVKAKASAPPEK